MQERTDKYLGIIIILGVVVTMATVGLTIDKHADISGSAMSAALKDSKNPSYVWTNKLQYSAGELIIIKWDIPDMYDDDVREIHLLSEETGAYYVLAKDLKTLKDDEFMTRMPNLSLKGKWVIRITVQPYASDSPFWLSKSLEVQ